MSFIRNICFSAFLLTASAASASPYKDLTFNQDLMITTSYNVITISSINHNDHITAYDIITGSQQWTIPFYAKIISCKLKDGYLYVFAKERNGMATYVFCINPQSGFVFWDNTKNG